jgi:hypothetical protein
MTHRGQQHPTHGSSKRQLCSCGVVVSAAHCSGKVLRCETCITAETLQNRVNVSQLLSCEHAVACRASGAHSALQREHDTHGQHLQLHRQCVLKSCPHASHHPASPQVEATEGAPTVVGAAVGAGAVGAAHLLGGRRAARPTTRAGRCRRLARAAGPTAAKGSGVLSVPLRLGRGVWPCAGCGDRHTRRQQHQQQYTRSHA